VVAAGIEHLLIMINKTRRTKAEIDQMREIIVGVLSADAPMTVRQVFYQLVNPTRPTKRGANHGHGLHEGGASRSTRSLPRCSSSSWAP
jgi:hypothetical protein